MVIHIEGARREERWLHLTAGGERGKEGEREGRGRGRARERERGRRGSRLYSQAGIVPFHSAFLFY